MNCKMENKKIDKSKVKPNGVNKILCGACQEVLASLKEESVDLTVTSPPYDNIRDYKGYSFEEEDFKAIITQLFRVTKKGGVVVWIVGDATMKGSESGTSFRQALGFMEAGFKLHDTMIYEKNTSSFPAKRTGKRYTQIFEYMFVFCKGKIKTGNLICDKPNKWAGHTNWGKNTQRGKDGKLKKRKILSQCPISLHEIIFGDIMLGKDSIVLIRRVIAIQQSFLRS